MKTHEKIGSAWYLGWLLFTPILAILALSSAPTFWTQVGAGFAVGVIGVTIASLGTAFSHKIFNKKIRTQA